MEYTYDLWYIGGVSSLIVSNLSNCSTWNIESGDLSINDKK